MKNGVIPLISMFVVFLAGCPKEQVAPRTVRFDTADSRVRVMTFNIRYGTADDGDNSWLYRKGVLFDQLATTAADVACLQEVREFQKNEILGALSGYGAISTGRDDGLKKGEQCCILYRKDRFEVSESGTFWFSDTPEIAGSKNWGNTLPRICTWARLVEKAGGKGFFVYNVHLDHQSEASRIKSAELMSQRLEQRDPKEPFVIMGDFNCVPESPPLAYLLGKSEKKPAEDIVDVLVRARPEQKDVGTFHAFTGKTDGTRIDMILTRPEVKVGNAQIDLRNWNGRYSSDHFAVMAELDLF